jgi:hypothetical protein
LILSRLLRAMFPDSTPPRVSGRWGSYTESRFRPFVRRREMTLRPDFVSMRERKPCFLLRFVFFGLNRVIFMWLCSEPFV